jgi:hypothetical protein
VAALVGQPADHLRRGVSHRRAEALDGLEALRCVDDDSFVALGLARRGNVVLPLELVLLVGSGQPHLRLGRASGDEQRAEQGDG